MKEFKIKDLWSYNYGKNVGCYQFEVQAHWGDNVMYLDADNAAQAKRIALPVFNGEMSQSESEAAEHKRMEVS